MNLFFWKKQKQTPAERAAELMPALIEKLPEFVSEIRKIMNTPVDGGGFIGGHGYINIATTAQTDGNVVGQLYDFILDYAGTTVAHDQAIAVAWEQEANRQLDPAQDPHKTEDPRIPARPKDIETELERIPTPWDVDDKNIDEKIAILKDKTSLSSQRFVKEQINAMIKRMENRRHYR